jgi:hypothetical protein
VLIDFSFLMDTSAEPSLVRRPAGCPTIIGDWERERFKLPRQAQRFLSAQAFRSISDAEGALAITSGFDADPDMRHGVFWHMCPDPRVEGIFQLRPGRMLTMMPPSTEGAPKWGG